MSEDELFGMMSIAREHQQAVKTALDGLAVERAALAAERVNLERSAVTVGSQVADVFVGFRNHLITIMAGAALVCIVAVLAASWLMTEWQRYEISSLIEKRDQLQNTISELEKRGGKIQFSQCDGRLCAAIDSNASGYTDTRNDNQLRILKGY